MNNLDLTEKKDLLICGMVEKYSEWLEMSENPDFLLLDFMAGHLIKLEEENKMLKKIAYHYNVSKNKYEN